MRTAAIIIGASDYGQYEIFSPLPAAADDARWYRRLLLRSGYQPEEIKAFVGPQATKSNVVEALQQPLPNEHDEVERLLIFISAHGATLKQPAGDISVLYLYDTKIADRQRSSLSIAELLNLVTSHPSLREVFLVIDACHMALQPIIDIISSKMLGSQCTFCCIVGNDGDIALEGVTGRLGEFSDVILTSIDELTRTSSPSLAKLIDLSASLARRTGLSQPRSITVGDLSVWPFLSKPSVDTRPIQNAVDRTDLIAPLFQQLRKKDFARLVLVGESGSGKTSALRQLAKEHCDALFISFPKRTALYSPEEVVETLIASLNDNFQQIHEFAFQRDLDFVVHNIQKAAPLSLVVIDGGENISPSAWAQLMSSSSLNSLDVITTAHRADQVPKHFQAVLIPALSSEQSHALAAMHGFGDAETIDRAHNISGGHPIRLLKSLSGDSDGVIPSELRYAAQMIALSGGFIDENLFVAFLPVRIDEIDRLRNLGILADTAPITSIHDSFETPDTEELGADATRLAFAYWTAEFEGDHRRIAATKAISLFLERFVPEVDCAALGRALQLVEASVDPKTIQEIVQRACSKDEAVSALAIDILSRRGNLEELDAVLKEINSVFAQDPSQIKITSSLMLARARASWWLGMYEDCREFARCAQSMKIDHRTSQKADLEIAIADFFVGQWDDAIKRLRPIAQPGANDLKTVGWAQLILGSCLGLRGVEGDRGRQLLFSAGQLLEAANDAAGVAIAKGNRGEISWKIGNFAEAEKDLSDGLRVAIATGMKINQAEAKRNLIETYMRSSGPDDNRIAPLELELRTHTIETIGAMELMQVANTLATLYLYRDDSKNASKWISIAIPLVKGNREYALYTNSNCAIYAALDHQESVAIKYTTQAARIGVAGRNRIGLSQILQDAVFCLARRQPHIYNQVSDILLSAIRSL
jgi:tetratricopeptide (TPR) repeat protein